MSCNQHLIRSKVPWMPYSFPLVTLQSNHNATNPITPNNTKIQCPHIAKAPAAKAGTITLDHAITDSSSPIIFPCAL